MLLLLDSAASAADWKLASDFPDFPDLKIVRERHPSIESHDDLTDLLSEIGRRRPISNLEANFVENLWVISGKPAQSISEINFKLATRLLNATLEGATQRYLGRTNSTEIEETIYETVKAILEKDGYPNASVQIKRLVDGGSLSLVIEIDERDPCYIAAVRFAFHLPKRVRFAVSPGDICDTVKIKTAVDELEDTLRNLGYTRLQLSYPGLVYTKDKLRGIINIDGSLGSKIQYKIIDKSKTLVVDEIFNSEDIEGLDPTVVSPEAMSAELTKRYRSRGYVDAKISQPSTTQQADNSTLYTYSLDPGPKYIVANVAFEGTTILADEELLAIMNLDRFWGNRPTLNLDEIGLGIDALKAKYQELGFWDVAIREPRIAKDEARSQATVIVTVREGLQRTLQSTEFRGLTYFNPEEILKSLEIADGEAIDRGKLLKFEQLVREAYIEEGFMYAKVNLTLRDAPERTRIPVRVIVEVVEGPRVKVGSIQVVGLNKTQPQVVERELTFQSGDWYRPSAINSSRKTLVDLGIFRSVQISPSDRSAIFEKDNELDVIVEVREGKAGTVIFGPGYDIYRGFSYTAETSYTNLWGTGRQISIRGGLSQEAQQSALDDRTLIGRKIGAGYVEPFILGLPVDGKVSVSHKATADDFWKFSQVGELSLNHRLRHIINGGNAGVFYGQKLNREIGNPDQEEFGITTGNIRIGRMGLRLDADFRNNQMWPTMGSMFFSEASWARYPFGGDLKYFRWEATSNFYQELRPNLVLAYGASLAAFHGIEKENDPNGLLPATERLNAGGSDLVRGFALQLGPYVKRPVLDETTGEFLGYERDPIGGDRRVILKSELRYRLTEMIGASFFVDSGNAFLSGDQLENFQNRLNTSNESRPAGTGSAAVEENVGYSLEELIDKPGYLISRHYYSYGLACNFLTPIGAINFAYAWPLKEPKSERCLVDESYCLQRAKPGKQMYYRGRFELSVGAKF